jgi:hypothetical protein
MKLILENWNRFLLTESGMKTVADLMNIKGAKMGVYARRTDDGRVGFRYVVLNGDGPIDLHVEQPIYGEVEIESPYSAHRDIGPCDDAWQVKYTDVTKGWGPLLYDIAIEWATIKGGGLISDREDLSGDAKAVWDYYLAKRSDVDNYQLDDARNTLTVVNVDNCDQKIAGGVPFYDDDGDMPGPALSRDWVDSSLSKRYTKQPTTLNKLKELGRFIDNT